MLYVLRHGHTGLNTKEQERWRGWSQEPLDERGIKQAEEAARHLKDRGIRAIFTSELERGKQTAYIISEKLDDATVYAIPELNTWNIGEFTGKLVAKTEDELLHYQQNPYKKIPRGESYHDFYKEFYDTVQKIRKMKNTALLVLHGREVWALPSVLTNGKKAIPISGPPHPGDILSVADNGEMHYVFKSDEHKDEGQPT